MAPFIGQPQGFSAASLELLDRGLSQIWHEMHLEAEAKRKKDVRDSAGGPSGKGDNLRKHAWPGVAR